MVLFKSWECFNWTYPHLVCSLFIWNHWLATVLVSMRLLGSHHVQEGGPALVGNKPAPRCSCCSLVCFGGQPSWSGACRCHEKGGLMEGSQGIMLRWQQPYFSSSLLCRIRPEEWGSVSAESQPPQRSSKLPFVHSSGAGPTRAVLLIPDLPWASLIWDSTETGSVFWSYANHRLVELNFINSHWHRSLRWGTTLGQNLNLPVIFTETQEYNLIYVKWLQASLA